MDGDVDRELRVLILDESLQFVSELLAELRAAGYPAVSLRVPSLETMSLALDDASWDVVIADYSMPEFLAAGALELIRAKGLDTPLILVSSNLAQDVGLVALRAGADDYLAKSQLRWIGPCVERTLRAAADRRARRRAEEALREASSSRCDAPAEPLTLAVLCDPRGAILSCSADLIDFLGYRREEMLGRNWFQDFLLPGQRTRAKEAFLRALTSSAGGQQPEEYHIVAFDGTPRAVRWQTSVLVDAEGNVLGAASMGIALPRRPGPNETLPARSRRTLGLDAGGRSN